MLSIRNVYIKRLSQIWKSDIKFHFVTPSKVRKSISDHNQGNLYPQTQIVENLFLQEGIRRKSITDSGVVSHNTVQRAFANINHKRNQGQVGEKHLLWNDEEKLIENTFNELVQHRQFKTLEYAVEIAQEIANRNPDRQHFSDLVDIPWLERFCNKRKQFKLMRGHIVDEMRYRNCTRSVLRPWHIALVQPEDLTQLFRCVDLQQETH
ncbi:MAG: hypothetical protein EZS28_031343 [Streblomastix strix]|uniref:Uncharacterized protein n=1 Tax=Streblomastix strix TaxID=222440 RepID=A0A5J4USL5_9EUKA|nr:MAG: hypothetical protein EZS28_031343 [Streblomastix strix]